ncbi:MAG: ATPase [Candidatus Iainarchaeum archaeon]|uniref:ATPase n=1 Tax=Candidatus Iainarchaeum sp. TaxID=3101447 RepID=A0A497JHU1_9ARCH|nr:MAG: ATPase [Candidatus Diapherotrites archaeon]
MEVFEEVYIPDSTVIVGGALRRKLVEGKLEGKIVVHIALVRTLEKLATLLNSSIGITGLRELVLIKELVSKTNTIKIEYTRELPSGYRYMEFDKLSEVDRMIGDLAVEWNATLITCDEIQYLAAKAAGINVLYLKRADTKLSFEKLFTEDTMSIHLKENVPPLAKVGFPGKWDFKVLRDVPLSYEELEELEREIIEASRAGLGFIEVERPGSTIVQLKDYRIVITRPPFSDGLEITIVKPLVKLRLEDYKLPAKLIERLEKRAEGILIAGAPGAGKTTFAQALAEYYHRKGKIVKTIESPRDMQLPDDITQYSKNYATSEELHDVLLLSRPDYTFFDEMRDTRDFELYADLRLAGVGMVGVVHATSPIDAIQRFIGRVELGMIPSIIDTVIFIKDGYVKKVYELETKVKIPHGLREVDLARPVVVVKNFLTGEPEYEIYVFGDRTFVVPVKKTLSAREARVKSMIERTMKKYLPSDSYEVAFTEDGGVEVRVEPEYLNSLTAKIFRKLKRISNKLGISVEVRPKV